jgi:UDP-glucose-4-epimerase GalE
MHGTNILVTGGAGFVGSHVCKALAKAGYRPIAFDNLERGHAWAVKWGPFEYGDLRDEGDIRRAFEARTPSAVIHLAAYTYVAESVIDPSRYYENNIGGTAKLLAACAAFGCRRIVLSSSSATYGIPAQLPLVEETVQRPVNPYGYTKLVAEQLLKDVKAAHGIEHVSLRHFNAAGADPEGELGEAHEPETHLIPLVLFAAIGRQPSVKIFGGDYPTRDGTCIRDYVHVSDLADAHVAALEWLASSRPSTTFNLGTGRGFSVAEVVQASEKLTGRPIRVEICPARTGDPPTLIADSTKARELLGWRPKFTDLDQQIEHAWRWFRTEMPQRE